MFRFVPRIAAVLLLVVAGALAPAAAGERPFNASGTGVVDGDLYASNFEATHLGKGSLFVRLFFPLNNNFFLYPYSATFTSANGDEVYFEFDEVLYQLDYHEDEAIWVVNATVTFTGGTGRFQDGSGSANAKFIFDPAIQFFHFQIDGSIDY